ncbi:hypothetical protein ACEPAH_2644 [Sanghuangporus vaninii]
MSAGSKSHNTTASATKDSTQRSLKYTSVTGLIELTENAGIDDNLRDFVKGLKAEAAKLGNGHLKNVRLFYSSPDAQLTQQIPYNVKVVLELPGDRYAKIAEGTSMSSFMNAFLKCESGVSSFFSSDSAASTVVNSLLSSVHEKVDKK